MGLSTKPVSLGSLTLNLSCRLREIVASHTSARNSARSREQGLLDEEHYALYSQGFAQPEEKRTCSDQNVNTRIREKDFQERYTDAECETLFRSLFPARFSGEDVLAEIAPEGWAESTLHFVFHPTVDQIHWEAV